MANADKPNGFRAVGTLSGSPWQASLQLYECDSSASNIFPGDLVKLEADGKIDVAAAGDVELIGVCVGVPVHLPSKVDGKFDHFLGTEHPDLYKKFHESGSSGNVLVAVGPDVLYEAQEDDGGSALALTDIGANVDILATSGDTTTGNSQQELDRSTVATTAAQMRIVRFVDRVDNEIGDWARWIVRINENHFTKLAGV